MERDTRTRIIVAARDLLTEGGIAALSMRKVAATVGVSATAIYRHFDDKDALLSAAVTRGAQVFSSYLLDALREAEPLKRLVKMGERYFEFARENPHDYHVLFMLNCREAGMEKLDEKAKRETNSTFVLLVDRVKECQQAGVIGRGQPEALALYIWSSLHGLASLHLSGHLGRSTSELPALEQAQLRNTLAALGHRK